MKTVVKEGIFLVIASTIILPTATVIFAYMTGKTVWQVLYR